ncbi:MAG: ribonuclease E/G [Phenylobacterium sp.]|uniref:ribonuclease E/G n=1 Tax=Phenylobacterium sp. TaxID=1871053 RepID=UPI002736228A|nr:ribonuclease E/G [Phenylobacterium sp.]MDP3173931.1 ribonuclease E/G [Phenylobacterium sp.]
MSERRLYLDAGVGETRGVVTLDGKPERLLIRRDEEDLRLALGARLVGRARRVDAAIGAAFIDLGDGAEAMLPFKPAERPVEGSVLEVEIRSEARHAKLAVVRLVGEGQGAPRLLDPPPPLRDQLAALVRNARIVDGADARRMADAAQAEALQTLHALPGGGVLAIEPTRALTALDIDLGDRKGADAKRVTRQVNLVAIAEAARLLRLKGLGGLVVIDLVGRGHDGAALLAAARLAFAPDNPGVALGPISRFGTLELTIPRRAPPLHDSLCGAHGGLADRALAQALIRRLEAEARANPGARLVARASPDIADAARPLAMKLAAVVGARFTIVPDAKLARERFEVAAS